MFIDNLNVVVVVFIGVCVYFAIKQKQEDILVPKVQRKMCEIYEDRGFKNFCQQLWDCDENRLVENKDYELDLGGRTYYGNLGHQDKAADPLFTWVKPEVFERPTYQAFIKLLDNYESETGVAESVTPQEYEENWNFIDKVFKSKPMQLALRFLRYKGKVSKDDDAFKQDFYDMWFKLYRRTSRNDSSGFEHVFVGETRGDTEVIGFHNWIQFYLQEKVGNVDYKGFMASDKNPHLLTIQFSWKGEIKPKGSSFIGISPEFEIALYTVCYLMGQEAYKIYFDGEPVIIKCHQIARKIGTCYPQMPPRENKF